MEEVKLLIRHLYFLRNNKLPRSNENYSRTGFRKIGQLVYYYHFLAYIISLSAYEYITNA